MGKDAYYFPHDSNARNDEKCSYIISKYGLTGYGLYWMFIECMHEQSDGKLTCNLIDGFSVRFNVDITLLKQFYNDAITIELFVTDGIKYWSDRCLRNKQLFDEKRIKKSQAGIKGMQSRWGDKTNLKQSNNSVITKDNKGKESKVKESKEEENILYPFLQKIEGYPYNNKTDKEMMERLKSKYPKLDIEAVINDWAISKLDKPLKKDEKPRSQIATFCTNAVKWGNHIKQVDRYADIKL